MSLLQHRMLNGWPLFFLVAALTLAGMMAGLAVIGVSTPEATVSMIRLSVAFASPWVFIAFATSGLVQLFPGPVSNWLLRNRRYAGLSFAAGFGWQAVFIAVLFALHASYYWEEIHVASDLLLRSISYVVLIALVITSFFPVRRKMRREHWRWLQLIGIWYFWAAIWVSYAVVAVSGDTRLIPLVYTVLGLLALVLRLTAYLKKRAIKPSHEAPGLGA